MSPNAGLVAFFALLLGAGVASAHVSMVPDTGAPGSTYDGAIRVGHGCSGSATTAIRVEVPKGAIATAHPKAGWKMIVQRDVSFAGLLSGGRAPTPPIRFITWRGHLDPDAKESFPITLLLPKESGPIYFPTVQTCESGEVKWVDLPAPSQTRHDLKSPAPVIEVGGAASADPMAGMEH